MLRTLLYLCIQQCRAAVILFNLFGREVVNSIDFGSRKSHIAISPLISKSLLRHRIYVNVSPAFEFSRFLGYDNMFLCILNDKILY